MNYQDNQDEYNDEISLYKRALNFVNSPRPAAENKPASSVPAEGAHKGHVVDRDNDQRLKENKNKREEEQARQESGQSDEREAEEHKKKVEERFNHLQKMENDSRKISRPIEAAFLRNSPKPLAPKTPTPKPLSLMPPSPSSAPKTPAPKAPMPGQTQAPGQPDLAAPPRSSFTYKPKQMSQNLSTNVPKNVAETTQVVPKKEIPAGHGQEEMELRLHPKHGPMVQRLLGPKPPDPNKMKGVYRALNLANQLENHRQTYKQLQAALEKSETVEEKNTIQIKISQTASLIANLGGLNKNV